MMEPRVNLWLFMYMEVIQTHLSQTRKFNRVCVYLATNHFPSGVVVSFKALLLQSSHQNAVGHWR